MKRFVLVVLLVLGAAACGSEEEKVDCIAACAGLECGVVGDCTCGGCKVDEECKEGVCCTKDGGDCAAVCAGGHCGRLRLRELRGRRGLLGRGGLRGPRSLRRALRRAGMRRSEGMRLRKLRGRPPLRRGKLRL